MQLHRISGKADWDSVPIAQQNRWQRLGARSKGVMTPGNGVTLVSFAIVLYGLLMLDRSHTYWLGIVLLAVGRLGDLLDGYLAEHTGTKGPVGEFLDVTADKLATLATVLVFYAVHLAPWWVLTLLIAPQVITALIKIVLATHKPIRPSRTGKISMALTWVCMLLFILVPATGAGDAVRVLVDTLALIAAGLGYVANYGYYRAAGS